MQADVSRRAVSVISLLLSNAKFYGADGRIRSDKEMANTQRLLPITSISGSLGKPLTPDQLRKLTRQERNRRRG